MAPIFTDTTSFPVYKLFQSEYVSSCFWISSQIENVFLKMGSKLKTCMKGFLLTVFVCLLSLFVVDIFGGVGGFGLKKKKLEHI